MANYWMFVNGDVKGPYSLEQLIRVRGFSRSTQVCVDDGSGKPQTWVSPSVLPEFSSIFKTVDQITDAPPRPSPRPPPKPVVVRPPPRVAVAPAAIAALPPQPKKSYIGVWVTLATLIAAGAGGWHWYGLQQIRAGAAEKLAIEAVVLDKALPEKSEYGTIRQCIADRRIDPRWEVEPSASGVFQATLSWYTEPHGAVPGSAVYAFEVNPVAQTVRGLNTAASKLLADGFVIPPPPKVIPKPRPIVPSELFPQALSDRQEAVTKGDYSAVWSMFSQRKRSDMIQAGISETGFVRLQNLTHKLESDVQQKTLKTKKSDETHMLALLRQSQANHPDIFLKQQWVYENKVWRLDDEEKKSVESATTSPQPPMSDGAQDATPAASGPATSPASMPPAATPPSNGSPAGAPPIAPSSLPGVSN